jgi:hypothetical protein
MQISPPFSPTSPTVKKIKLFVYRLLEHAQETQRHFIDAELSSMLSESYVDDSSEHQQVCLAKKRFFLLGNFFLISR